MRVLNLALALAFLGTMADAVQPPNDSDVESKLMAMEHIVKVQASQTKDVKVLDAMLDDGFQWVDSEGRLLNKTDVLVRLRAVDSLELIPNSMVVKLQGDTAIVTGLYRIKGVQRGQPFVRRGRFVDTWLYKGGRWVVVASLSTPGGN